MTSLFRIWLFGIIDKMAFRTTQLVETSHFFKRGEQGQATTESWSEEHYDAPKDLITSECFLWSNNTFLINNCTIRSGPQPHPSAVHIPIYEINALVFLLCCYLLHLCRACDKVTFNSSHLLIPASDQLSLFIRMVLILHRLKNICLMKEVFVNTE